MKKVCLVTLILFFNINLFAQSQEDKAIYGAYQFCPFHCITIKLNADKTFEYVLNGDLYNNQRTKGNWEFIGKNRIKAKSIDSPLEFSVIEKTEPERKKIEVQVLDLNGALWAGVELKGLSNNTYFSVTTNEGGSAILPKCDEFEISVLERTAKYKIKNKEANLFNVVITTYNLTDPLVDDIWLIEKQNLFVILEDGTKSDAYKKLSRKQEKKIFP